MTSGNMANTNIAFGSIRNMASVNMLIRKGYLLAGVVMAANVFAVNEVKASINENNEYNKEHEENNNDNDSNGSEDIEIMSDIENKNFSLTPYIAIASWFLLNWENTINFIGGLVFSSANNYFKWWNYDRGKYCELGCWGLRSGRLINIFQIDINLNLGRGILWLIPGTYNFIRVIRAFSPQEKKYFMNFFYPSFSVGLLFYKIFGKYFVSLISSFIVFFLQGFFSAPLTVHISNFSFSISLDSLIWMGIGSCAAKKQKWEKIEGEEEIEYEEVERKEENIYKNIERNFTPMIMYKRTKSMDQRDMN